MFNVLPDSLWCPDAETASTADGRGEDGKQSQEPRAKSNGAEKKLDSAEIERFPEWQRKLPKGADADEAPMMREHFERFVENNRVNVGSERAQTMMISFLRSRPSQIAMVGMQLHD